MEKDLMMEHVAHMEEVRNVYKILVKRHERKRPLKGTKCRWEDNNIIVL
jgi:hypothetical protein